MNKKYHILFVCTDNFGRSVVAEYCLKYYLMKNNINNIEVSSAGTTASSDISHFSTAHLIELKKLGIDASNHKRVQLDKKEVKNADLIIVFDNSHKEWIKNKFNINVFLFNKIYKNEDTEIMVKKYNCDTDKGMIIMTNYINNAIPDLFRNIQKEYL